MDGASCEHVNKKSDVVWITKGMKVRTFVRIGEVSNNIFLTNAMILSSVSTKFPAQEKLQGSVPQSEIEQVLLKLEAFNVVLC